MKELKNAVARLVAALRHKPEGSGLIPDGAIEMPYLHFNNVNNYLQFFQLHYGFGRSTQPLTEMNARVIFWGGKGGRCVVLTMFPLPCAYCIEMWEPQPPGNLRACPGLCRD